MLTPRRTWPLTQKSREVVLALFKDPFKPIALAMCILWFVHQVVPTFLWTTCGRFFSRSTLGVLILFSLIPYSATDGDQQYDDEVATQTARSTNRMEQMHPVHSIQRTSTLSSTLYLGSKTIERVTECKQDTFCGFRVPHPKSICQITEDRTHLCDLLSRSQKVLIICTVTQSTSSWLRKLVKTLLTMQ